ncbi:MAG: PAS domain S-box protein [Halobacteria archaeon]|nr:PAS domain S-box protein [Halobacteria archaeon]
MPVNRIKLLLVEPTPDDTENIIAALQDVAPNQFAIKHVGTIAEAVDLINKKPFDVVLFDIGMAKANELDTCCYLSDINPSLPYIVLGDKDNQEMALAAVKHGAQDYLNKSKATGQVLIRVVRYAIERKRSDESLQTSKEGAQQLLEYADEGIFSVDVEGDCTFINPSAIRMLGYDDESELLGKHIHALIHHTRADGSPCLEKECRVYASTQVGKIFHVDDEILWRPDGSSFPVEYRTAPTRVNGIINGSVVTFSDITQRKQDESNLKAAHDELEQRVKERTRHLEKVNQLLEIEVEHRVKAQEVLDKERDFISALLDTVGALVCILDTEGKIVVFNRACAQTTGYRFDEVVGKYVWDYFLIDEEIEPVKQVIKDLHSGQFPSRYENYWLTKSGKRRLVVWSNTVLQDAAGVVQNVIGTGIDITEKRKIEEKEKQRVLELAHVSRLSTMGEMATQIAHELNQPLSAITTYSDACLYMLNSEPEEITDLVSALNGIKLQAQRSGEIIRGLRDFVKKGELNESTTDINALIHAVMNLAMSEIKNNKIDITFSLDDELPMVVTEKILIEQVVLNLVRNAIEAMTENDSMERELHIQTALNNEEMITVKITDTGPGLKSNQIENIFNTFVTTKKNGIGMGLPISRTIIEAHGGTLMAEDGRKTGASFVFTLPLNREE